MKSKPYIVNFLNYSPKRALTLLFSFLFTISSYAATYYFSSSDGNDGRSASQAQSPSTPWRSLDKLNSFFASLNPGDQVLFKRGDTFYGTINITKSGTSSAPIVLGAYGSGAKPVISGFTTVSSWTSKGGGIYESTATLPNSIVNVVTMDDEIQEMGRYPNSNASNKGFLYFEAHNSTSSITDNQLSSTPNWAGAEMVVRSRRDAYDRAPITAHSGGTLYGTMTFAPTDNGFGYFIQNDIRTLDQKGEWFYNKSTHKLSVYFGSSSPSAVQASTKDLLVYASDVNNVTLRDLSLQGANQTAMLLRYSNYITVTNCDFLYSGNTAMELKGPSHLSVTGNTFNHTLSDVIRTSIAGNYWTISDNVIKNTALFPGMTQEGMVVGCAILVNGDNQTLERNTIDSVGFIAIRFTGNNVLVKNNVISYFNLTKCDGGGIYSYRGSTMNRKIVGNIVMHGIGETTGIGRTDLAGVSSSGIYFDNEVTGVEVANNTVFDCSKTALYIHNSYGLKITDNTFFDNGDQITMTHDAICPNTTLHNLDIKQNIFFAKQASQNTTYLNSYYDDINQIGSLDSNYYCRPIDETFVNTTWYKNSSGQKISADYDLKGWQTGFSYDPHSKKTSRQLSTYTVNSLLSDSKIVNGTFNQSISGFSTNPSGTGSWISSKLDGGTFQASVPSSSSTYSVIAAAGGVSTSKKYILRFSIQSSKDAAFSVKLRQNGSPYATVTEIKMLNATTSRQEYEFLLTPSSSQSSVSVEFTTKAQGLKFWLDNVKLYEADVTMLDLNKLMRLEYNATNSSKTIALDAAYVDVKNKSYSGSVTLAPYSSIILMKDTSSNQPTVNNQAPLVSLTSPTANASFTAPASITITANASDTDGSISKVEFFSGSTLIGTDSTAPYTITWSGVAADSYSLTAIATDNDGLSTTSAPTTITVTDNNLTTISKSATSNAQLSTLQVNFQDATSKTPQGWFSDYGQAFGLRTSPNQGSGNSYGWINSSTKTPLNLIENGRNRKGMGDHKRKTLTDSLLTTLVHMQHPDVSVEGAWEAKVVNGTYDVTVSVGDTDYLDSKHTINIEGVPAIVDFVPTATNHFKTATVTVTVSDGRLTVDANGGSNTKINYISIRPSSSTPVTALSALSEQQSTTAAMEEVTPNAASLRVSSVYPNPSTAYFNVLVQGRDNEAIVMNIVDVSGRIVESKTGITANSTIQIGQNLKAGIYFIQLIQGAQSSTSKIIKQ